VVELVHLQIKIASFVVFIYLVESCLLEVGCIQVEEFAFLCVKDAAYHPCYYAEAYSHTQRAKGTGNL